MKRGLGRGLDALFSIYDDNETKIEAKSDSGQNKLLNEAKDITNSNGVEEIDIRLVNPNKNQPRKRFDAESLKELAESIKVHGVIQPIIVNEEQNNHFTIIAGERRFRASIIAGKQSIPAIIRRYTPKQIKEISLIENLQREDLNPIEAARAIKELMDDYSLTQEDVSSRVCKSRSLVANTLRLLSLMPQVIDMIEKNVLSAGHGKCLVAIEDKNKQVELAKIAVENKLTVRDLERLSRGAQLQSTKGRTIQPKQSPELKELLHRMQKVLNTKVIIHGDDNKGKILINYFSRDDLDRINDFILRFEK
ncbi:MAG: ParB/RepB/Spo0J family partition protein [Clostridia bacterium]|nr:ParB/RepB/Spo0J family partition protein [Clostridia bacterium]